MQIFNAGGLVKAWVDGVEFETEARLQVERMARLPFIYKHVAIMPDVHMGIGATVGSVIPTRNAVIPAAVGVDIGCGMVAHKLMISANSLPDNLAGLRSAIERAVPHGRSDGTVNDTGSWKGGASRRVQERFTSLNIRLDQMLAKHPKIEGATKAQTQALNMFGTLGSGNHFVEVCLDENNDLWLMLHSGSRGIGNRIGTYFIDQAKQAMEKWHVKLEDPNLAYLPEGTELFNDYWNALTWAQEYAFANRDIMMDNALLAIKDTLGLDPVYPGYSPTVVNCHHNYASRENHFGQNIIVTRKGAVCVREGMLGIIPGSMGARSYIVRGKGNKDSFDSCSHGAGRRMSRSKAKQVFTIDDHAKATEGVECRKDAGVLDETPGAYKDIDKVMEAQSDLVDIVHTLKAILCVKG